MTLAELQENDLSSILENDCGFSNIGKFTVKAEKGATIAPDFAEVLGDFNGIAKQLDLSTGVEQIASEPSFTVRKNLLQDCVDKFKLPFLPQKHWLFDITFKGVDYSYSVSDIFPDIKLGSITYMLKNVRKSKING